MQVCTSPRRCTILALIMLLSLIPSVAITQVYARADCSTQAAALDQHAKRVLG